MNELALLGQLAQALPSITSALLECDKMIKEYEHNDKLTYSDHITHESLLYMFKSGKIDRDTYLKMVEAMTPISVKSITLPNI